MPMTLLPNPAGANNIVMPWREAHRAPAAPHGRSGRLAGQCLGGAIGLAGPPADRLSGGAPERLAGVVLAPPDQQRAQRDHVGELLHGLEVAERDKAFEAERIEAIAGQKRRSSSPATSSRERP